MKLLGIAAGTLLLLGAAEADPATREGDYVVHDFKFVRVRAWPTCACTTRRWARRIATGTAVSPMPF